MIRSFALFGLFFVCQPVLAQNLTQQKMCADQSRKFFTDPAFKHNDYTDYASHYDPKADHCYISIRMDINIEGHRSIAYEIFDAFEGNLRADLSKTFEGKPYGCSVKPKGQEEIFCKTEGEFKNLIEKYFGAELP